MNTTKIAQSSGYSVAVVGGAALAALALGVALGHYFWPLQATRKDEPAKYVLYFGNSDSTPKGRVTVNETAFRKELSSPKPNWKTLTIRRTENDPAGGDEIDLPTEKDPSDPKLISRLNLTQERRNDAPCTLHVTQKVGLNNKEQVERVLTTLVPE